MSPRRLAVYRLGGRVDCAIPLRLRCVYIIKPDENAQTFRRFQFHFNFCVSLPATRPLRASPRRDDSCPPMVRFKNRYLTAEFNWHDGRVDDSLTETGLVGVLRKEMSVNFGDVGGGFFLGSMSLKYWNPVTGLAVVRVGRDIYRQVWASLTLLREINGRAVAVQVTHCGSTLGSSQNAAISRSEIRFDKLLKRGVMPGGERAGAKNTQDASRVIQALQS